MTTQVGEFWPTGVMDDSSFPYGSAYYHQVAYRRGNF
jgi:hypothetical protein